MLVFMTFERDHRPAPFGDNFPGTSGTALTITSTPATVNGVPLQSMDNLDATILSPTPASATQMSQSIVTNWLSDNDGLPTGTATFDFSNFNIPANVGDEVTLIVAVYENVSSFSSIAFGGSTSATGTTMNTISATASAVPAGRAASDIVYLAHQLLSSEGSINVSAGWNTTASVIAANTAGSGYTNPSTGFAELEPTGISAILVGRTYTSGNPSVTFTKGASSTNKSLGRMYALLPLAKPSISGTVYLDTDGSANINGTGINGGGLYVNAIDTDGIVRGVATVAAGGTWTIAAGNVTEGSTYSLQLSKNQGTIGNPAPAIALNTGWATVGEATGATGNDGTPDGILSIPVGVSDITGLRYGITNVVSDMAVTKTIDNPNISVGNNVVFTITVTNNGASANTGVMVTDLLPAGYSYVNSTMTTGTYNNGTGTWNIGNMANTATATLTITATVLAAGSYTNTAAVSGVNADPNMANNTASVTPVVCKAGNTAPVIN